MIQAEKVPFPDPDAETIHEWMSHPGRLLYQKFLASQAAELMVQAENMRITDESLPNEDSGNKAQADEVSVQAKVIRAANKILEEVIAKDYQFYTVELKPETITKSL